VIVKKSSSTSPHCLKTSDPSLVFATTWVVDMVTKYSLVELKKYKKKLEDELQAC
jgi:hypothetical protein